MSMWWRESLFHQRERTNERPTDLLRVVVVVVPVRRLQIGIGIGIWDPITRPSAHGHE
jgi:hypothetical protein